MKGSYLGRPYDVGLFLDDVSKSASDHSGYITFVGVDSWPPELPYPLHKKTPHTSEAAFKVSHNSRAGQTVQGMDNIDIINWTDLRKRLGETVCNLLASEPSAIRAVRKAAPPWDCSTASL